MNSQILNANTSVPDNYCNEQLYLYIDKSSIITYLKIICITAIYTSRINLSVTAQLFSNICCEIAFRNVPYNAY